MQRLPVLLAAQVTRVGSAIIQAAPQVTSIIRPVRGAEPEHLRWRALVRLAIIGEMWRIRDGNIVPGAIEVLVIYPLPPPDSMAGKAGIIGDVKIVLHMIERLRAARASVGLMVPDAASVATDGVENATTVAHEVAQLK